MGFVCSTLREKYPKDGDAKHPVILSSRSVGDISTYQDLTDILQQNPQARLLIDQRKFRLKLPNYDSTQDSANLQNLLNCSFNQRDEDEENKFQRCAAIEIEFHEEELKLERVELPGFDKFTSHQGALQKNTAKMNHNDSDDFDNVENVALKGRMVLQKNLKSSFSRQNQIKNNNYHALKKQLTEIESISPYLMREKERQNQNQLHFAFLFASPLVMEAKGKLEEDVLPEIGFQNEFEQIIQALEQYELQIKYKSQMATIQSLIDTLRQQPIGLHFSCHGFQNEPSEVQRKFGIPYQKQIKDLGDFLIFESRTVGVAEFLFKTELSRILSMYKSNLKFVVVASCHSQMIGEVFKKAGAEHVVCIEQSKEVLDSAASVFSRAFYIYVFKSRLSICQAFENAKLLVQKTYNKKEADIFQLLTQNGHDCDETYSMLTEIPNGKMKQENKPPSLLILPASVSQWVPRDFETYEVLQKLCFDGAKIIEIFGYSGAGKSAIASKVVHYLAERNLYPGGIVYLNCSGLDSACDMINQMIQKIDMNFGKYLKQRQILNKSQAIKLLLQKLHEHSTNHQKILLVFDNIESVVSKDSEKLTNIFNSLVIEKDKLQILFTTSIYVDKLERFVIKNLKKLTPSKAYQLFLAKIPSDEAKSQFLTQKNLKEFATKTREIDNFKRATELLKLGADEIAKLQKIDICDLNCTFKPHKGKRNICIQAFFEKHPMFKLVSEPLSICLAASQLHHTSISKVYENILKSKAIEDLDDTLLVNIVYALQVANNEFSYSQDIIFILSQAPSGLCFEDLQKIFSERSDLQKALELLEETSLLTQDQDTNWYQVQNFVEKFIDEQLTENDLKVSYNMRLAKFYVELVVNFKQCVSSGTLPLDEFVEIASLYYQNFFHTLVYLRNACFESDQKRELESPMKIERIGKDLSSQPRRESILKFQAFLSNAENRENLITKLSKQVKEMIKIERIKNKKAQRKFGQGVSKNDVDLLNLSIENITKKMLSLPLVDELDGPDEKLKLSEINVSAIKKKNKGEIICSSNSDSEIQDEDDDTTGNPRLLKNLNDSITVGSLDQKIKEGINAKFQQLLSPTTVKESQIVSFNHLETLKPPPQPKSVRNSFYKKQDFSDEIKQNVGDDSSDNEFKNHMENLFTNARRGPDSQVNPDQELENQNSKNESSKQINSVLGQFIGKELKKISDSVTENEKMKYKRTIAKFKLFDNYESTKPTEVMENHFFNLLRKQSYDKIQREATLRSQMSEISQKPMNLSSLQFMMRSAKLLKSQIQSRSTSPTQKQEESHTQEQLLQRLQGNKPTRMVEVAPEIQLDTQKTEQSQFSISSYQSFGENRAKMNSLDKVDSFASFYSMQTQMMQKGEQILIQLKEIADFQKQKNALMIAQYQDLLYEFFLIQILSQIEQKDFDDLFDIFEVNKLENSFIANIDLLNAYLISQSADSLQFSQFLEQLAIEFKTRQNEAGLGILNVLQAHLIIQAKAGSFESYQAYSLRAAQYIDQAEIHFTQCNDEEGLNYCKSLNKKISRKILRIGTQAGRQQNKTSQFSNFLSVNPIRDYKPSQTIKSPLKNQLTCNFSSVQQDTEGNDSNISFRNFDSSRFTLVRDETILNLLLNRV